MLDTEYFNRIGNLYCTAQLVKKCLQSYANVSFSLCCVPPPRLRCGAPDWWLLGRKPTVIFPGGIAVSGPDTLSDRLRQLLKKPSVVGRAEDTQRHRYSLASQDRVDCSRLLDKAWSAGGTGSPALEHSIR